MGAIEQLTPYLEEMLRCTRCGFCQAACPVYEVQRMESSVARGKVQMLLAANNGALDASQALARHVFRCLDCRLCQQTCPGGVRTDEIFDGAKEWLAHTAFFPPSLRELERRVTESHNIAGEENSHRLMWREGGEGLAKPAGQVEVLFFTGCVASLYPMVYGIPRAFASLMELAGVEYVTLGGEEWCCGYPMLSAGLSIDLLVEHNLELISRLGVEKVVATCPSCYKTWKNVYPSGDFQVLHSTEFLLHLLEEGRFSPAHPPSLRPGDDRSETRLTYHDPCDLGRKAGIYEPPRQILSYLPGIELVEMKAHRALAQCCGGGGNLESYEAELTGAIASRRLSQALDVGAEAIVTACQQCQRTLSTAARRSRQRLPVLDIAQVLLSTMTDSR